MPGVVNELLMQEYEQKFEGAEGVFLTEYTGLSVEQINTLRRALEEKKAYYFIVKNRLAKIYFEKNSIAGLADNLKGSTAIVVAKGDVVEAAKLVKKYEKEFKPFKIKKGYVQGSVLKPQEVIDIADIPSREVLLTKLAMCFNAPITGFVRALAGVPQGFVTVLNAIKDKKDKE